MSLCDTGGHLGFGPEAHNGYDAEWSHLADLASGAAQPLYAPGELVADLAYAIIPDQVPEEQRGRVSGYVGFTSKVGTLVGTGITALVGASLGLILLVPAAFGVIAIVVLIAVLPDRPADRENLSPFRPADLLRSLWVNPFAHRDFGWAWLGRFLLFLGYSFFLTFQAYVITDHLGYSDAQAPSLIFYATLTASVAGFATAVFGGRLSDHLQRRKIFVVVASVVIGAGLLIIGLSTGYASFLVGATVVGLGMGTFLLDTDPAALPAEPGLLEPAEGRRRFGHEPGVEADHADFQALADPHGPVERPGEDVPDQAPVRVVGPPHDLVLLVEREDRRVEHDERRVAAQLHGSAHHRVGALGEQQPPHLRRVRSPETRSRRRPRQRRACPLEGLVLDVSSTRTGCGPEVASANPDDGGHANAADELVERGFITRPLRGNTLQISPPFITTDEELRAMVREIDAVIAG